MTSEIPLKKALELVTFFRDDAGTWRVRNVHGDVIGNVGGFVWGTIRGREWTYVETTEEKLQRLIKETGNQELIDAFNQLEDNS